MITSFNIRRLLTFIKEQFALILSVSMCLVILIMTYFSYQSHLDAVNRISQMKNEVDQLNGRKQVLQMSRNLIEGKLEDHTLLLSRLIPESEDYFNIIIALEKISFSTGFIIEKYKILFSELSQGKLSISADGSGDIDAFVTFLKGYQFAGGRFVTIESIQYSQTKSVAKSLALNFYTDKAQIDNQAVPQLTEKDILFMEALQNKVDIVFKPDIESSISASLDEYTVSDNPF